MNNNNYGVFPGLLISSPTKGMEKEITIDSFTLLSVIGKGSYAKVVLVKKRDASKLYALKILKKDFIEKKNQTNHVMTERNVLVNINHPFVIKLAYAFQNERKLFFALEYCPGGELFNLLQKKKRFTEDQARFYATQMILAIEHLHKNNIIYRDLKPENVLLDSDGYIRITDFGLSRADIKDNKSAMSVCGTPEYLAPEIILKIGHGKAVDWWTLGAILYEMMVGLPPFYTSNREELFEKIKFGVLKIPASLSLTVKNLLEGLFKKDPEKRLGGGLDDAKPIKEHPWFKDINWDAILEKKVVAPFVPVIKSEIDVSNFDREFTETEVNSMQETTLADIIKSPYKEFSWNGEFNEETFMELEQQ